MQSDPPSRPAFVLLSNHGHVLLAIAESPDVRIRDIAARVGITERAAQSIVNDLATAGYVHRTRVGRRNAYTVEAGKPLPHPAISGGIVDSLLSGLVAWHEHAAPAPQAALDGSAARPALEAADDGLDRLTALAAALLHAPISVLSMLSGGAETIAYAAGAATEVGQELPLGEHVRAAAGPRVVFDMATEAAAGRPDMARLGLRAFVALPLAGADGSPLGTLCVGDVRPRRWTRNDIQILTSLAAAASSQIEMHVLVRRDREAARRHLTLLDSLPETLILVLDRELRIQTASGEALARRGHRPDAIIGLTLDDVAAPEHAAGLRAHYQAGLDGKRHQFVYTASEEHTYTIDVVPIEGADGEIASVMAIGREHLVYGRADQWDSERLRALIENVPGAVYRCAPDHEGAMTFISGHVESISGWAPAEFLGDAGRSYASIIHPDDRADVAAEVARASAERRPFVCEYRILTRGGATRWVRERGQAIRSADDQAVMFLDGAIFAIEEGGRRLAA